MALKNAIYHDWLNLKILKNNSKGVYFYWFKGSGNQFESMPLQNRCRWETFKYSHCEYKYMHTVKMKLLYNVLSKTIVSLFSSKSALLMTNFLTICSYNFMIMHRYQCLKISPLKLLLELLTDSVVMKWFPRRFCGLHTTPITSDYYVIIFYPYCH